MHPVATALRSISDELNADYVERDDVIYSMCLALLSGEHHFVLGPPGTAKSQLVRAMVEALSGATYFEVALSKTRPAEAVLGPLNIKEFRENGNYFLKRHGFASDVDICFFDEIGKMSPVLGHDLLALLNERVYHEVNGGRSVHAAPLHVAFTASNEMPMNESDDAAALWDRLLIRTTVDYVQNRKAWASMLTSQVSGATTKVTFADVQQAAETEVPAVTIDNSVLKTLMDLRLDLEGKNIRPSDRRWRQSMKVIKAAAFLEGDTAVNESHLGALRFTLWDTIEEIETIATATAAIANPFVEKMQSIHKALQSVGKGIDQHTGSEELDRMQYAREANAKLTEARNELDKLLTQAGDRQIPGFAKSHDLHFKLQTDLFVKMFQHDEDTARVAAEGRLGMGMGQQRA